MEELENETETETTQELTQEQQTENTNADRLEKLLDTSIAYDDEEKLFTKLSSRTGWVDLLISDLKLMNESDSPMFVKTFIEFAELYKNGTCTDSLGNNTKGALRKAFDLSKSEINAVFGCDTYKPKNPNYENDRGLIAIKHSDIDFNKLVKKN